MKILVQKIKAFVQKRQVHRRVRRGVHLLNRRFPGWMKLIDLKVLDIGSPTCCIIGQLTVGRYRRGCLNLGLRTKLDEERYGFLWTDKQDEALLNFLWKEEIQSRLARAA